MLISSNQIKYNKRTFKGMIIILLIIVPLTMLTDSNTPLFDNNVYSGDNTVSPETTDIKFKGVDEKSYIGNYSFDPESLATYIESLYDSDRARFRENYGGYTTTIATYEALFTLRVFGLDYYQFGGQWQINEDAIADHLYINLEDPLESGGFLLTETSSNPSVEGTFGVVNSFWLMNELNTKLKPLASKLLNYIVNHTYSAVDGGFHEVGETSELKTTFQALSILETIYNLIIEVASDANPVPQEVNQSIEIFMGDSLSDIFNFINDTFVDNSHFHDNNEYRSPIENTWYGVKSIAILERFSILFGLSMPTPLINFQTSVTNWLNSLFKNNGLTKGGFGFGEDATTKETGLAYAIHDLFNTTDSINDIDALNFVNSSQFLPHENRTYITSERIHLGGFGPNNLTYSDSDLNNRINIHDTFYASVVYLLSDSVFESIDLSLETAYYQESPEINISNYIVQGEISSFEIIMKSFNYKSHGSLNLDTSISNWNISHQAYNEYNSAFYGKSTAIYDVQISNDSLSSYNWTLGSHFVTNKLSIRNLPVIPSPEFHLNTSVIVGYAPKYDFDISLIKPGDIVGTTFYFQNRSTNTFETTNISKGTLSVNISSPSEKLTALLDLEPINTSTTAVKIEIPFLNDSLLGNYELSLNYNISNFEIDIIIPIVVNDDVTLVDIESNPDFSPGDSMSINVSLEYSNGYFTPDANASLFFISNKTQTEVFNLTLEHISGNIYSSRNQNCPTRLLDGFYSLTVRLYWNMTSGYEVNSLNNDSLQNIQIKGTPRLYLSPLKTDYRDTPYTDEASIYYGETANFSFKIGFDTPHGILNITEPDTKLLVGLFNYSTENIFIQLFEIAQKDDTFYASALINTNLGSNTYGVSFKIASEWNDSFVFIKDPTNISETRKFDITLEGEFSIETTYYSSSITSGLPTYSLEDPIVSIAFEIKNTLYENIPVPYLNLYGYLDFQDRIGTLNLSLPGITSAIDENGADVYLLSIPTANLDPNTYEISIYTRTAITSNLKIGNLSPGFKLITTFDPAPVIQLHEALILISSVIFIGLLYLNFRKKS